MHGNNEHCLAAVRVFCDSIQRKESLGTAEQPVPSPGSHRTAHTSTEAHGDGF